MIKEHFEGPVGDYCIARNTIKCLFDMVSSLTDAEHLQLTNTVCI